MLYLVFNCCSSS